jgi:hypothetical protein
MPLSICIIHDLLMVSGTGIRTHNGTQKIILRYHLQYLPDSIVLFHTKSYIPLLISSSCAYDSWFFGVIG